MREVREEENVISVVDDKKKEGFSVNSFIKC